jgi:hypothetical protein
MFAEQLHCTDFLKVNFPVKCTVYSLAVLLHTHTLWVRLFWGLLQLGYFRHNEIHRTVIALLGCQSGS